MAKAEPICAPFALRRPHAAAHVGCSVVHFDKLVGVMPRARVIDGVKVWLRPELEEALLSAPTEGRASICEEQACDAVFGSRA